jgi:hypothetical protein
MILDAIDSRCEPSVRLGDVVHLVFLVAFTAPVRTIFGNQSIPHAGIRNCQLSILPSVQYMLPVIRVVGVVDHDTLDCVFSDLRAVPNELDFCAPGDLP